MDLQLANKVVIVTGGAKGIGAACVRQFAAEGARVSLVDRDRSAGTALADQLQSSGHDVHFVETDLAAETACAAAVESTIDRFLRLDVLVNNAGFNDGLGLEASPEQFMASVTASLGHVYAMTHYAVTHLKVHRGSIINVGSKVAVTGQGHTSGYAAAKGAINALTREWAVALAADGIRVNCVLPAECESDQYDRFFESTADPEATRRAVGALVPLENRLTRADEVAAAIVILASNVSSHTTGQWVFVDGGYTHLDRAVSHRHTKWGDEQPESTD